IVGALPAVAPGTALRLWGEWTAHPQYGQQFTVTRWQERLPATMQGIKKYLGSGLIKGVGPVTADRIVDRFGLETLRVIEEEPDRLLEVPGLGRKRRDIITRAWAEQQAIKEVMLALQSLGVNTGLAVRIFKTYRDEALTVVKTQPYRLAEDVFGIGFITADKIARALGIAADSPERARAGLKYALSKASDDGHVYLPRTELLDKAAELLAVDTDLVETALASLEDDGGLARQEFEEGPGIYLPPFYGAESAAARRLRARLSDGEDRLAQFAGVDFARAFAWRQSNASVELAPEQRDAVRLALTERVTILTGGPGTGKTTTIRAVLSLLGARQGSFLLAAPTGRAAQRMSEAADAPAQTIHRLIGLRPGGEAAFNEERPLDTDLLVVDEVSMLDILLINTLLKAVGPGTHLLLVGDVDQLPSVGPGQVLRDLIASEQIPTVRLTQIFRQAQQSGVVRNAHRINRGEFPEFGRDVQDFFFFPVEEADAAADLVADLVLNRIPRRFSIPPGQIQVLSPMHCGAAGVGALNLKLQEALNPPQPGRPERPQGARTFRPGDRVMQIRNNYDKCVFNGSLGVLTALDMEQQEATVRLDEGGEITYEFAEMDELTHAFAISVHKSQGSEYAAVVLPLLTQHYTMLARNLLYTAVTRAKRLVVLVGSRRALGIAIKKEGSSVRYSALGRRLSGEVKPALRLLRRPGERERRAAEERRTYGDEG
ncbi:MAG: ATP-dependent RecD-like DNA helicase, partial [Chloroflexi bacterium]|nr:ATP-dependent RecD-like DNA helicase [Chloroflexota bacterium]